LRQDLTLTTNPPNLPSARSDEPQADDSVEHGSSTSHPGNPGNPGARRSLQVYSAKASTYEGPMPPPDLVAKYEKIHRGAAQFFFDQVKTNADHRRRLEERSFQAEVDDQREQRQETLRGQWLGAGLATVALSLSALIIWKIPTATGAAVASVIGGSTVIGLVSVYVLGRRPTKDANDEPSNEEGDHQPRTTPGAPTTRTGEAEARSSNLTDHPEASHD